MSRYRKQDYALGHAMLALRTTIGLTQAELGHHLGVNRRSVSGWETGDNYPKPDRLKQIIALGVKRQAFPTGHEAKEIRALWEAAHQKMPVDEKWLSALLSRTPQEKPVKSCRQQMEEWYAYIEERRRA